MIYLIKMTKGTRTLVKNKTYLAWERNKSELVLLNNYSYYIKEGYDSSCEIIRPVTNFMHGNTRKLAVYLLSVLESPQNECQGILRRYRGDIIRPRYVPNFKIQEVDAWKQEWVLS